MLSEEEQQRRRRAQLREQRRRAAKRRRRKALLARTLFITIIVLIVTGAVCLVKHFKSAKETSAKVEPKIVEDPPDYEVDLLDINNYSRPGMTLEKVNGIVIHYTANPGATAIANRNYFENLKDTHTTKASSHFVVGLEGEIVQCIPTAEIAYASNDRNSDTISIECCYKNEDGSFEQATYDSVIKLTAWLCAKFGLTSEDVIRHYDVTGKLCPLYYVEHEDAWAQFKKDVDTYLQVYKTGDENG